MPALLLIRHGQALDVTAVHSYDGLSPLGEDQAARVGEGLRTWGVPLARVFAGPLVRQQRTAALALGPDASIVTLPELEEHAGQAVVEHVVGHLDAVDVETARLLANPVKPDVGRAVAAVVRAWALGRIRAPVAEDFRAFRARVARALELLGQGLEGAEAAVAFTSGGVVGAAVGHALGLDDAATAELGLAVDNASITELRFSRRAPGALTLKRFNGVSHLDARQRTGI